MAHFLNVKNQDIKVKAGAEMRISLTTDATLHCGDKASFLINEFGVSRLRIGKKKFKVDDKRPEFWGPSYSSLWGINVDDAAAGEYL